MFSSDDDDSSRGTTSKYSKEEEAQLREMTLRLRRAKRRLLLKSVEPSPVKDLRKILLDLSLELKDIDDDSVDPFSPEQSFD